jgi:hypothetical protein
VEVSSGKTKNLGLAISGNIVDFSRGKSEPEWHQAGGHWLGSFAVYLTTLRDSSAK